MQEHGGGESTRLADRLWRAAKLYDCQVKCKSTTGAVGRRLVSMTFSDSPAADSNSAQGLVCLPSEQKLHRLELTSDGQRFHLVSDPLAGKVTWRIHAAVE